MERLGGGMKHNKPATYQRANEAMSDLNTVEIVIEEVVAEMC